MLVRNDTINKDAGTLVNLVMRELVITFNKAETEAALLVKNAGVYESLLNDPMGLHDSPYKWSVAVLAKCGDIEALKNSY